MIFNNKEDQETETLNDSMDNDIRKFEILNNYVSVKN